MYSYDLNPLVHLAMSLMGTEKYREKCVITVTTLFKYPEFAELIDINSQDRLGRTVLHIAAMNGVNELIEFFN